MTGAGGCSRRQALRTAGLAAAALFTGRTLRAGETLDPAHLRAAAKYSAEHSGVALLVRQGGRVIFEEYRDGHTPRGLRKIYSGTKGFWILAALKAAEDGVLSLDECVSETIPEWRADPGKSRITLRQLLNFTSGLDAGNHLHGEGFADRNALALRTAQVAAPGSAFIYGPASLQVFHEVWKRKLAARGDTPTRYLERHVMRPLGLGPQRYLPDKTGNPLLATGFAMSTRQWARLGQVIVEGGRPVLSSGSLALCLRGSAANGAFGMGFWNNRQAASADAREVDIEDTLEPKWHRQNWRGVCLCRDAPGDLVAAIGSGYQRLFVIPSRDLVVVRNGAFARISDGRFLRLLLGRA